MDRKDALVITAMCLGLLLGGCGGAGGATDADTEATDPGDTDGTEDSAGTDGTEGSDGTDSGTGGDTDSQTDSDTGCSAGAEADATTVRVTSGALRGVDQGAVRAFRGVPFAAPPVGEARWRPPSPPGCFVDGLLVADAFGPVCPQLDKTTGDYEGNEDCLTLNVWTPATLPAVNADRPVLFFIHGGGNSVGGASESEFGVGSLFSGELLAEATGAVVVTIQYRLGPLGWLTHGLLADENGGVSGNWALRDQVAALTWVRDHIAQFGGDKDQVLLFGESAGALDTCMLYVCPHADGLFAAALMQSGGCPGSTPADAQESADELLAATGCGSDADPLACLRAKSPAELLAAMPPEISVAGQQAPWQPHVDGDWLPDKPMDLIADGLASPVPLVVGANADETARDVPPDLSAAQYTALVTSSFGAFASTILARYPVADYASPAAAFIALTSDVKFICPARRIAAAARTADLAPVYRYFFDETIDAPSLAPFGAFHGLELIFVFGRLDTAFYSAPADELALGAAMQSYWAAFARGASPVVAPGEVAWPEYTVAGDETLLLTGGGIEVTSGIRDQRCDEWDQLANWR